MSEGGAFDWRGHAVSCTGCAQGGRADCRLLHACVHDRYARRIDRFFALNPHLSNQFLDHPHFEVRIRIAARLPVSQLLSLQTDPDELVRRDMAARLPASLLDRLYADPSWRVRLEVAQRGSPHAARTLAQDPAPQVREATAARAPALMEAR